MGWVKESIEKDRKLDLGIPKLWIELRDSLVIALSEFETYSKRRNFSGTVTEANPNVLYISTVDGLAERTMQVSLDRGGRRISALREYPSLDARLDFLLLDGDVHLAMDGKALTVEQASRLLLEPLLRYDK